MKGLVCPDCQSPEGLATTEKVLGAAGITAAWRLDDGTNDVVHDGYTEMDWDSSETVGVECSCGWTGNDLDDLVEFDDRTSDDDGLRTRRADI